MMQQPFPCRLLFLIAATSFLLSCDAFFRSFPTLAVVPLSYEKWVRLDASQLLEFVEPETGVTVKLVGSMHYNPTSIELATNTIQALAEKNELGSVIIESCDIRYDSSKTMSPFLKTILRSEMGAACDVALAYNRPVVLRRSKD
jgi:hypothetical protein